MPRLRKGSFPRSDELPALRTQIKAKRRRRDGSYDHYITSALVRRLVFVGWFLAQLAQHATGPAVS